MRNFSAAFTALAMGLGAILLSTPSHAQSPIKPGVLAVMEAVDCNGHTGHTTICVKNASTLIITKLKCGSYDVPVTTLTHTIPAGHVAASIDLGNSTRTCRKEGVTAMTSLGMQLNSKLDGATVDDSTQVVFRD